MAQAPTPVQAGLRIDVDTLRGTRLGVPQLLDILRRHSLRASFFFSVGPDNMGRHLWRLLNPVFAFKMLRTGAPSLYGWDILLRGTAWPGPGIAARHGECLRDALQAGHEVGLHAWDHHRWQARSDSMTPDALYREIERGVVALREAGIAPVTCSAAAGWKCTDAALAEKEKFSLQYNSDCRGHSIFRPNVAGVPGTPQIPVTLPTYDELIGRDGVTDDNYNDTLLHMIRPERLNVLTIHAEVEGISRARLFDDFLTRAMARGIGFVPLGRLLPDLCTIPSGDIDQGRVPGRQGTLCVQAAQPQ